MSKHCEVCNRSYPDDLKSCPHCAEVVQIGEADVVDLGSSTQMAVEELPEIVAGALPVAPSALGPDSAVDLGLPALSADPNGSGAHSGAEGSGISVIEWASLVEEEPQPAEPAAASFDDPADAHLIAPPPAAPAGAHPAFTESTIHLPPADDSEDAIGGDLEEVRTIFAGDASASFARRGPAQPAEPPADADDSALNLLGPATGEEVPASEPADAGSGVDLGAAPVMDEFASQKGIPPEMLEAAGSGVDLASAELEAEVVSEAVGAPNETGHDLPAMLPEEEAVSFLKSGVVHPPIEPASDSGVDLSAVEVLEEPPTPSALVAAAAPASDSGIDLSGVEVVDAGAPEELSEVHVVDSGVDLSAVEVVDVAPTVEPVEEAAVRPISDSGIDLSVLDTGSADSGPQAGIEKNTPGTSDSGVDRIAAEVESGMMQPEVFDFAGDSKVGSGAGKGDEVDLDEAATTLTAGQLPSGEEEVDLTEVPAGVDEVDSSAVDLGGTSATFPAAPPEPASSSDELERTRPYEAQVKSIHGEEEMAPSEVDLGARHQGDSGKDFFEESAALAEAPVVVDGEEESLDVPSEDEESAVSMADDLEPVAEDEEAAVEEELGAVEEEEEVAPSPPKKEKRRSTAGAWGGGLVLGGVVTAVVLLGLWLFKIEPPTEWRGFVPGGSATRVASNGASVPPGPGNKSDLTKSGDSGQPADAGVAVRKYLMGLGGQAPNADDPAMRAAIADLDKAPKEQSEDALFWLGVAKEAAKDPEGARTAYQKGLDGATNNREKQRFQAGLDRLSAASGPKAGGVSRAAPAFDPALFLLVVTGLASESPPPPPAPAAPEEAGSKFWEAAKLARGGKYDDAIKALGEAVARHKVRRFTVLGQAQNPDSDPTEEIFLRSCQELQEYWALREQLSKSTLPVVMGQDPAAAVASLVKEGERLNSVRDALVAKPNTDADAVVDAAKAAAKSGETLKALRDALAVKPEADGDAVVKAATDLGAALKAAQNEAMKNGKTIKDVRDALAVKPDADADAVVDAAKAAAKSGETLKALRDALAVKPEADGDAVVKAATDLGVALKAARNEAMKKGQVLKDVADALKAGMALKKDEDDEAAIVPAVKEILLSGNVQAAEAKLREVRDAAEKTLREAKAKADKTILDLTSDKDLLQHEKDRLQTAVKDRRSPEDMLPVWLVLLGDRKDQTGNAKEDADNVLKAGDVTQENRGMAHAVKGIALRNEEKYAEAKAELELARKDVKEFPKAVGEWLQETKDPSAYYADRAEEYRLEGRNAQALVMLNRALKAAAPTAPSRLLVERGTLLLNAALAHGNGRVGENDADLTAAIADAEEAQKANTAEAFYLGGRIAEARGKADAAADDYGKALKAHDDLDAEGARYRAARARMLMLLPHDGQGQPDAAVTEALKLAADVLSIKDADVPFEARAQALAVEGLWTEALKGYADGLSPQLGQERAEVLTYIVAGHPALRRPTPMTVADPLAAAQHYAAGLQWYNDREYEKAQQEFLTAVEHDGQDARYYYYLGLSRLMQGDRDAFEDFEQGSRLERQNRPSRAAVSAALERVQGESRERLNAIRDRPR